MNKKEGGQNIPVRVCPPAKVGKIMLPQQPEQGEDYDDDAGEDY